MGKLVRAANLGTFLVVTSRLEFVFQVILIFPLLLQLALPFESPV